MEQANLLTAIEAAMTFFEQVAGRAPTPEQVQRVLALAGVNASLDLVKRNGEIVLDVRQREQNAEAQP